LDVLPQNEHPSSGNHLLVRCHAPRTGSIEVLPTIYDFLHVTRLRRVLSFGSTGSSDISLPDHHKNQRQILITWSQHKFSVTDADASRIPISTPTKLLTRSRPCIKNLLGRLDAQSRTTSNFMLGFLSLIAP